MGRKKKPANGSQASAAAQQPTHYDVEQVKLYARGQWASILSTLGGIDADLLDGNHHACLKCGGTDRFRFTNLDDGGSILCNQCERTGDGLGSLVWLTGRKFAEVLADVAGHLGIAPTLHALPGSSNGKTSGKFSNADPAEHLKFLPWNDSTESLVGLWCLTKPPITLAAIRAVGGVVARYRDKYTVLALPVWGSDWRDNDAPARPAKPCGWSLYNITGGTLPKWGKPDPVTGKFPPPEQVKVKLTYGSKPGIIADRTRLAADATATTSVWKLEGPSDLLAFLSLPDLPADVAALTNANGAGEQPHAWMLEIFADRHGLTCHDADKPGQNGALTTIDPKTGKERPGWANIIASAATESRNVVLPYPIEESHGKDLRDFAADGGTFESLAGIAAASEPIAPAEVAAVPDPIAATAPLEAPDNYHRLARINIERYRRSTPNGALRYWRSEWYKYDGHCYRKIEQDEFKAKVGQAVKEDFDRIAAKEMAEWDGEGDPPTVRNVGHALVTNVVFATAQLSILSGSVELNSWIDGPLKGVSSKHRHVALKNGILDIDGFVNKDPDFIKPHSPDWFSLTCLPFDFDPAAQCPRWFSFLRRNMEGDRERIAILQEWAGYLLLPNTNYQKFVFFEGEGANGKSVYLAAIEAMLGTDNCSHVQLESFGQRFMLTQTLGKLANIASECSEMDSVAEGNLKAFASGDRMTFDRKGITPVEASPTARLMLSANVKPRFADKSNGLWRRMIHMPWRVMIPEGDRVIGMDKIEWWEESGELPGIFNWAIAGLHRLGQQKRFTKSAVCDAAQADYQQEVNPMKVFLNEHYIQADEWDFVVTKSIYDHYKEWSLDHGYRPTSDRTFGREVTRLFPNSQRERQRDPSNGSVRRYVYKGIKEGNSADAAEDAADLINGVVSQELF